MLKNINDQASIGKTIPNSDLLIMLKNINDEASISNRNIPSYDLTLGGLLMLKNINDQASIGRHMPSYDLILGGSTHA